MVTWSDATRSLHDLTSQYLSNRCSSIRGLIFTLNNRITSGQLSVHIWMHSCHVWDLVAQTNLEVVLATCGHILEVVCTQMCPGPHRTSTYISTVENLLLLMQTPAHFHFSAECTCWVHCCPPWIKTATHLDLANGIIRHDYLSTKQKSEIKSQVTTPNARGDASPGVNPHTVLRGVHLTSPKPGHMVALGLNSPTVTAIFLSY